MLISAILREFGQLFPVHQLKEGAIDAYCAGLARLSDEQLAVAFTKCREECERFPVPADFVRRAPKLKAKRGLWYNWADPDFERAYTESILPERRQGIRRISQADVLQIRQRKGEAGTESRLVGSDRGAEVYLALHQLPTTLGIDFAVTHATFLAASRRIFHGETCSYSPKQVDELGKQLDAWRATGQRPAELVVPVALGAIPRKSSPPAPKPAIEKVPQTKSQPVSGDDLPF